MTKTVTADLNNYIINDRDGKEHKVYHHKLWYMAPITNPAILLHNARIGEGIVLAMTDLLDGINIKPTRTIEKANKAEEVFEQIRLQHYSNRPSRLRCHFLSLSKEVAEERLINWEWQNSRRIVECYLILSSGRYHFADINEYEKVARGEVEISDKDIEEYAHRYWKESCIANPLDEKIELLADSALYFPDWKEFPKAVLPADKKYQEYREEGWVQL